MVENYIEKLNMGGPTSSTCSHYSSGEVITWLTNNPAGLKLNEPVNTALASFFQYHIHLWKSECLW
ncbi:hypothetical protein ANCDUO_09227 [Ancylostoma duodenale]|uniref:Uncharacterized protein n=1 Tax=Ancylostoma duodenale TaxID=51022 RepID=A0A0C2GN71_9BILA|nr:hypothetical protein ANCDUO_09227 [Ancylostoma duodenale]